MSALGAGSFVPRSSRCPPPSLPVCAFGAAQGWRQRSQSSPAFPRGGKLVCSLVSVQPRFSTPAFTQPEILLW